MENPGKFRIRSYFGTLKYNREYEQVEWFIEFGFSVSLLVNALLFLPQAWAIFKSKSTEGISLITFLGFNIIQAFTVLHGFLSHDYVLSLGFLLSMITCGVVSLQIVYYRFLK